MRGVVLGVHDVHGVYGMYGGYGLYGVHGVHGVYGLAALFLYWSINASACACISWFNSRHP